MIIKICLLIIATVGFILLIVVNSRSKKYEAYIENLDSTQYQLKELYPFGYALAEIPCFAIRPKLKEELIKKADLIYQNIYSDYYATLAWAQFLSFSCFTAEIMFLLASLFEGMTSLLMFLVLVLAVVAYWNMFISHMKEEVEKRSEVCLAEFPNMISMLSLLLNSGMVLRDAWQTVAYGKQGTLYDLMQSTCEGMNNGDSDIDALYKFGVLSDCNEIKKFTGLMIQGLEKGNADLKNLLLYQSNELWAHRRQILLQKGEAAAGKLIIPVGITFAGIIMIIMMAAMSSFSL